MPFLAAGCRGGRVNGRLVVFFTPPSPLFFRVIADDPGKAIYHRVSQERMDLVAFPVMS